MTKQTDVKIRKLVVKALDAYEERIRAALERDSSDIRELQSDWQERDSAAERTLRDVEWNQYSSLNQEISEIEESRKRLEDGTYGYCEDCGEPVAKKRLLAVPTARKCFECQESAETETGPRIKFKTL